MGEIGKLGTYAVTDPNAGTTGARRAWARIAAAWPERDVAEPGVARIAVADIEGVLSRLPVGALDRAVTRFVGGEVGDPRFPPKLPELAAEARRICAADASAARLRRSAAESRLALPDMTRAPEQAERRAEIAAQVRKMAHGWKSRDARPTPARYQPQREDGMTRDEARARSAEWHLERAKMLASLPVPKASPDLAAMLAKRREDAA